MAAEDIPKGSACVLDTKNGVIRIAPPAPADAPASSYHCPYCDALGLDEVCKQCGSTCKPSKGVGYGGKGV
jgi:hypothetical protein